MEIIQYTPIASKDFGIDAPSQLNKQLYISDIRISKKYATIEIWYDIVLLAPTGIIASIIESGSYIRDNNTSFKHFDSLSESQIGLLITGSVKLDMGGIVSFETYKSDLNQS